MGFYLRKAISVGPFRFNLSKSGIGVSAGITGLRFGAGPRGNYVHMGRGGLYYRATLPSPSRSNAVNPAEPTEPFVPSRSHATLDEIESVHASLLADSSSQELLDELNQKRAAHRLMPIVGTVVAVALVIAIVSGWALPPLALLSVLGAACLYVAHAYDSQTKTVVLLYDFEPETAAVYSRLHDAAEQLASCKAAWHIEASGSVYDRKYEAGADRILRRKPTTISKESPPLMKTNVDVVALRVGRQSLYFLPDRVLVYDQNQIGAVGYPDLVVAIEVNRFIERDPLPGDAEVVDQTWKYVNKSGGPDRRFKDNPSIPICLYESILLSSSSGLNECIQFSRRGFGQAFADATAELGKMAQA